MQRTDLLFLAALTALAMMVGAAPSRLQAHWVAPPPHWPDAAASTLAGAEPPRTDLFP